MKKIISLMLGLLFAANANATSYSLAGDIVDAGMFFTQDTGFGVGRIHGYGLDAPFMVFEGNQDIKQYSAIFTLDVDSDQFHIDFLFAASWQPGVTFALDDLDFAGLAPGRSWTLDVDTNLQGYSLELRPDAVIIGLGDTQFTSSSYFRGTFNISPVPEASTWALMGMGIGCVALLRRRTGKNASA